MIHGIHGNSKRKYPYTHGNGVYGAFSKAGVLLAPGVTFAGVPVAAGTPFPSTVENYAAEVAYPDLGINCASCHVNDSWKLDRSPLGSVVSKPAGVTDPLKWLVVSPKTATCTACHDSNNAIGHVITYGGGTFGTLTQSAAWSSSASTELCEGCHGPGGVAGVDTKHRQK
jgi:OmcA/MtrC family decaheme c-type cytochrome